MKKVLFFLFLLLGTGLLNAQNAADSARFEAFQNYAVKNKLVKLAPGERIAEIAEFFLGSPYVGSTLEAPGPERIRVNLQTFDCNTFVENVVVLSVLFEQQEVTMALFRRILETIRYRDGVNQGYPTRLHYASDWLTDNVSKRFFDWVNPGKLGLPYKPAVNYMSTHPLAYPALKEQPLFIPYIESREKELNKLTLTYVPKVKVTAKSEWIQTGDIIAITTNLSGLDFSHMGIAVRRKGKVYLLHASSSSKVVQLTKEPLSKYLAEIKKHTGIVVVRPL